MHAMFWALGAGCVVATQGGAAIAQTEIAARRECLQAIREQGVRGYALEAPRYLRTSDGASLAGRMVQGPIRLDFTCAIDRRARVIDLAVTRPPTQ